MCGLVGLVGAQQGPNVVGAMIASLRTRGPDETGVAESDWFRLGICRLAIIDLAGGRQPVSTAGGDVCLAFNGEIYNYKSLVERFDVRRGGANVSEAELLLRAYVRYGSQFVDYLDGDFAILVMDSRRRACYAFRDPVGVKPLYYAPLAAKGGWAFASHVRAFFQHPSFSTSLDHVALAERRTLAFWSSDRTCFDRIRQLPPGCSLELRVAPDGQAEAQPEIRTFATRRGPATQVETHPESEQAIELCSELIRRSVGKRVEHSEVEPIVLAWSGGIDSTILAALVHADYRDRIAAVTVYDDSLEADREYTERLAGELGLKHASYKIQISDFIGEFARAVSENPGAQPAYSAYFIGRAAHKLYPTAKVLLCGEGADEFFLGYPLFVCHDGVKERILRALHDQDPALVASSSLLQRVQTWERRSRAEAWNDFVDVHQTHQLVSNHLVAFDHACMAHSLECRVPFLDGDLLNYAREIPNELKVSEGVPKIHLRRVLERLLAGTAVPARSVLECPKSPAFFATRACTAWLRGFVESRSEKSALLQSRLVSFARDLADLFWIRSIEVVFLKYRGEVEGMKFEDLAHEVIGEN